MTDHVLQRVQLGKLGALLGEGGQAKVFHAPALTLPDAPGAVVFKQYREGHTPPHGLHRLVARRRDLGKATRDRLDGVAAWPLRVVQDNGAVCGVVLPLIPGSFFQSRILPGTGRTKRDVREVQNLFISPARARHVGMPEVSLAHRLLVCRDFASALHLLHRRELVVGDLNAKNALFRLDGRPSVMLVDCDAIRIVGEMPVVAALNAPDWDPPEGKVLSQATDRYKFGLFVLRCLSPGEQSSTSRDPRRADAVLDQDGRRLIRAALSASPGDRPTVQEWGYYLHYRVTGTRAGPVRSPSAMSAGQADSLPTPRHDSTPGWRRDPSTGAWRPVG
jgi:hypothetical protein